MAKKINLESPILDLNLSPIFDKPAYALAINRGTEDKPMYEPIYVEGGVLQIVQAGKPINVKQTIVAALLNDKAEEKLTPEEKQTRFKLGWKILNTSETEIELAENDCTFILKVVKEKTATLVAGQIDLILNG